jgi:hypothetical protein
MINTGNFNLIYLLYIKYMNPQQNFILDIIYKHPIDPTTDESIDDALSVIGCLKCYNELCDPIITNLKNEYDPEQYDENICLLKVQLSIYNSTNDAEFYNIPNYRIKIEEFYNNISIYGQQTILNNPKLKGAAHALLCLMLLHCLNKKLIHPKEFIVLNASGDLDDKSMDGLINYYEQLGFIQSFPLNKTEFLDQQDVPMVSIIERILTLCSLKEISPELASLLSNQNYINKLDN